MGRQRHKSGKKAPPFFALRHDLLDYPQYIALSDKAKVLLIDICRQYNGFNNGDFCLTLSVMRARGWVSNDTLTRATRELVEAGLLELTRQGGRNKCNLYGLTFMERNECDGKLDLPPSSTPSLKLSLKQ